MSHPSLPPVAKLLSLSLAGTLSAVLVAEPIPTSTDPNLEIILFASDPEIVTPVGAVTDRNNGDLYVVESHTHGATSDYPGPKFDRIKRFRDTDDDGRADDIHIFADGLYEALGLAFSPDGELHVVTSKNVFRLTDTNGDGVSDSSEHVSLLRLETVNTNPHGSLLAIAIDDDGLIYVSRGNVGGNLYELHGATGESLSGYGVGGDIVRINRDGSNLNLIATGFWNPFALAFDRFGRLIAADNDPDSRGPNRIVHIIEGGNYGYLARYGPTGLHPFSGWNADLPTVLPIAAGVGEAPSATLDLTSWKLGPSYHNAFAVTIWGEHKLSLFYPESSGASFQASSKPWIKGGKNFRPVDLAPTIDGGFYLTDWVLRDYPNHSRGAIWRVRTKNSAPLTAWPTNVPKDDGSRLISNVHSETAIASLFEAAGDTDPFIRTTAAVALAERATSSQLAQLWQSSDPLRRITAWQAQERTAASIDPAWALSALSDSSEDVKILGLMWIGDNVARQFLPQVDALLTNSNTSPRLFRFILATLQILHSNVDELYAVYERGSRIPRDIPPHLLRRVVLNQNIPAAIRALAVPQLTAPLSTEVLERLISEVKSPTDEELTKESMRTLVSAQLPESAALLTTVALNPLLSPRLRADAISLYAQIGSAPSDKLLPLLTSPAPELRRETARAFRGGNDRPKIAAALRSATNHYPADVEFISQINRSLGNPLAAPPSDLDDWQTALAIGGDSAAGERVFYEPATMCIACHRIENRGGLIGPDLSHIGSSLSRPQLLRSIIYPSDDVSPEYQGWEIKKNDGSSIIGLQLHLRRDGILIDGVDGVTFKTPFTEIESYDTMEKSLMPDGLGQLLPLEDLRNLIAYLESLR